MAKKKAPKTDKLPIPRMEFDEDCGNITLHTKGINRNGSLMKSESYIEIAEDELLEYAKALAKQLGLPLYANIMTKTKVV